MGGYSGGGPQSFPASSFDYDKSLNLITAHNLDLVRRCIMPSRDTSDFSEFLRSNLNGRPISDDEINPSPIYTNLDNNRVKNVTVSQNSFGHLTIRRFRPYIEEIHQGQSIHLVEDRIKNTETGSPGYFDELPEVRDLQHRFSVLHLGSREGMSSLPRDVRNKKFLDSLESLSNHLKSNYRLIDWNPYHHKDEPLTLHGSDIWLNALHHIGSFLLHESYISSTREEAETLPRARQIDFYQSAHKNIYDSITRGSQESLADHVHSLVKSYNSLWDKLDSGIYVRHPKFWSGHAFAAGQDRDQAWKTLTDRVYNDSDDIYKKEA